MLVPYQKEQKKKTKTNQKSPPKLTKIPKLCKSKAYWGAALWKLAKLFSHIGKKIYFHLTLLIVKTNFKKERKKGLILIIYKHWGMEIAQFFWTRCFTAGMS